MPPLFPLARPLINDVTAVLVLRAHDCEVPVVWAAIGTVLRVARGAVRSPSRSATAPGAPWPRTAPPSTAGPRTAGDQRGRSDPAGSAQVGVPTMCVMHRSGRAVSARPYAPWR